VIEGGEDTTLALEELSGEETESGLEHLDRHPLVELAVAALGEVDAAHSAPAQLLHDPPGPELDTALERRSGHEVDTQVAPERGVAASQGQEVLALLFGEHAAQCPTQLGVGCVAAGETVERQGPLRRRQREQLVESGIEARVGDPAQ
jgi:hypothetical protein